MLDPLNPREGTETDQAQNRKSQTVFVRSPQILERVRKLVVISLLVFRTSVRLLLILARVQKCYVECIREERQRTVSPPIILARGQNRWGLFYFPSASCFAKKEGS